jgi:uncharacterized protein (DUF2225 family)
MTKDTKAHKHRYDVHPRYDEMMVCTVCGFAAPLRVLRFTASLDALTARKLATDALLAKAGVTRDGRNV